MKKITFLVASLFFLLFPAFLCCSPTGVFGVSKAEAKQADFDAMVEGYVDTYIQSDERHRATRSMGQYEAPRRYIYEEPTVKNFSHLFWALGLYKSEDDEAVDEFMRINECEIYKNYNPDEIEWKEIRNATRDFLRENKEDFPSRFEFTMPIKLKDYDEERQAFEVQDAFKIESLRRFEFFASDFMAAPCSADHNIGQGYPRVLVLEFSRPFNLVHVPMQYDVAMGYMKRKMYLLTERFKPQDRTRARMYSYRDAYLFMKVKIFSYGKFLGRNKFSVNLVQMMGVLEGFEIYETPDKERLFFAQNYVTAQSKGKLDKHLKAQYELLLRKHKGEGFFH